jgi:AraC-like DNA-binding protein
MLRISIAQIVLIVLCFVGFGLWQRRQEADSAKAFLIVTVLAAVQTLFVSLRWDFNFTHVRIPQIVLAAVLPAASWLAFRIATVGGSALQMQNLRHALPLAGIILCLMFWFDAIDLVLIVTFLTYGIMFLRLAVSGDVDFGQTAFESVFHMRRAVWLVTISMLGSALVDILVFAEFWRSGGQYAPLLISLGNLIWLTALGGALALGSAVLTAESPEEGPELRLPVPPTRNDVEDQTNAALIQTLLEENGLAKDPNLTLLRLARRAGLPARSVSAAINRVHGRNVSQYINEIRVAEACRLLRDTNLTITQVIYESGFQTKSNFNREFLRVTRTTPREWRSRLNSH